MRKRFMIRILAWLGCAAALLVLAVAEARTDPPFPPAPGNGPGDELVAPRDVVLKTADRQQIAARFWPGTTEAAPGVVLLHMYKSDRSAWDPVVKALRDRGVAILAIDLRGHGKSAMQGRRDLARSVKKRDSKLFRAMHKDAIAAVRWLAKEGKCDAKRIALVGASVGSCIAVDAARRHPDEVAAVLCMSPVAKSLGLDTLAHLKTLPATTPLLLLTHRSEIDAGAQKIADARPGTRLVVYDEAAPANAGADRMWAHGTRMFGGIPLVEQTVASFVAAKTGSKTEDVVLDGIVVADGPDADPWSNAIDVAQPGSEGAVRAFRVGRRVLFGGTAPAGIGALRFEVQTGTSDASAPRELTLGPPQIVGVDLKTGLTLWSWGGMGSVPTFPGMGARAMFGKTRPVLRVVSSEAGTSFEGEWFVPTFGGGGESDMRLLVRFDREPHPGPRNGMIEGDPENAVDLPSR